LQRTLDDYIQPEVVTEPAPLGDDELSHVVQLRQEFGMNADPIFVQNLHTTPAAFGALRSRAMLAGGILFTPDETEQVFSRAEAEWAGYHLDGYVGSKFPESYGGTSVEGAHVVVRCHHCAIDVAFLKANVEEAIGVDVALDTEAPAAATLQSEALKAEQILRASGLDFTSTLDIDKGVVRFRVSDLDRAQNLVGSKLVSVESGFAPVSPDINKNQALGYNLVEGGQYIVSNAGTGATSGFAVQSAYGAFLMTAGHAIGTSPACNGLGNLWTQASVTLGFAAACQYGGNADAGLISTSGYRNTIGRVHFTFSDDMHAVTFPVSYAYILTGQTVCQTGAATTGMSGNNAVYIRCGVVDSENANPNYSTASPPTTGYWGHAAYYCQSGDSGAAVVWPTGYGFGAAGLHSGGGGGGGYSCYFTRFSIVMNNWGLSLASP
jgi:hypothetical protein